MRISSPFGILSATAVALLAGPAAAQNNSLYILQDNSTGGMSNTITVDQSLASRSEVGTSAAPVLQLGSGNEAEVTVIGSGSRVALSQRSVASTSTVEGNTVTLDLVGTTLLGSVSQTGFGNRGVLSASGANAAASLVQEGNLNTGAVSVMGRDASGTLRQVGDRNETALDVRGTGTSVIYNVIGNGLAATVPPSVVSNGATVTITQTGPGLTQ